MKDSEGGTGKEPRTEKWDVKSGFLKRLRPFYCPRRASTPAEVATLPLKITIMDNPNLPNYQAKKRNRENTPEQQEENVRQGKKCKEERNVQRRSVRPNHSESTMGMIRGKGYQKKALRKVGAVDGQRNIVPLRT
ncbi:hypothetical protein Tco_1007909, partial [Tanacetum coccineum]